MWACHPHMLEILSLSRLCAKHLSCVATVRSSISSRILKSKRLRSTRSRSLRSRSLRSRMSRRRSLRMFGKEAGSYSAQREPSTWQSTIFSCRSFRIFKSSNFFKTYFLNFTKLQLKFSYFLFLQAKRRYPLVKKYCLLWFQASFHINIKKLNPKEE